MNGHIPVNRWGWLVPAARYDILHQCLVGGRAVAGGYAVPLDLGGMFPAKDGGIAHGRHGLFCILPLEELDPGTNRTRGASVVEYLDLANRPEIHKALIERFGSDRVRREITHIEFGACRRRRRRRQCWVVMLSVVHHR